MTIEGPDQRSAAPHASPPANRFAGEKCGLEWIKWFDSEHEHVRFDLPRLRKLYDLQFHSSVVSIDARPSITSESSRPVEQGSDQIATVMLGRYAEERANDRAF